MFLIRPQAAELLGRRQQLSSTPGDKPCILSFRSKVVSLNASMITCYRLYNQERSIKVITNYLNSLELLKLQQLNKFFYKNTTCRVQDKFEIHSKKLLLTRTGPSILMDDIIQLDCGGFNDKLTFSRPDFGNENWISIQVGNRGAIF